MPRVFPFVGLRFDRSRIGGHERVTAPPYDVISPPERERYLEASPYNVIRLDLGGEPGTDRADERYARAAADLEAWRRDGVLVPTEAEAYYPYEMRFSLHGVRRRVRGLIAAVELREWGREVVPHERTMAGPVEDRLRLLRTTETDLSCIYAVFAGPDRDLDAWLDTRTAASADAEMVDEDGVEHRLWCADPEPAVAEWLGRRSLMIADGHHRYATALRYREERRVERGPGPWDRTMMFLVDAALEDPPVLPYHRIQSSGPVPSEGTRVRDLEEVLESLRDEDVRIGVAGREDGRVVHRLMDLEGEPPTVCRLHEQVLEGADERLRFTPDPVVAEEAVRSGRAAAAYLLPATSAATIRRVVDRGERLPQKSTFFWPKPRTGLILRPHEP
jgi:uncharacterized protein (DUF1015 family)